MIKHFLFAVLFLTLSVSAAIGQTTSVIRSSYVDVTQRYVPISGDSIDVTRASGPGLVNTLLILSPSANIENLTLNFTGSPRDGDRLTIVPNFNVKNLTITGATFDYPPTNLTQGGSFNYVYNASFSKWRPATLRPGQIGLDSLFETPSGDVAPVVVQCDGGGDEQALFSARALAATNNKTSMVVGAGCQLNNQWKLPSNTYTSLFGWGGAATDPNTLPSSIGPRITVNSGNIETNAPGNTAIDVFSPRVTSFNGVNIFGDDNRRMTSLLSNSSQNGNCCASNNFTMHNSSLGGANTLIGCPIDYATGTCASGTYSSPNFLGRISGSQFYSAQGAAIANNFSDLQLYNSEITANYIGLMPIYGGGGNQIGNNRFEFNRRSIIFGGSTDTNPNGNRSHFINSNIFTANYGQDLELLGKSGFVANSNIFDGMQQPSTLLANSDFAFDLNWFKGTGVTISGGVANLANADGALQLYQKNAALIKGYSYVVNFDLTVSSGSITPNLGGTLGTARTASGSYSETIVANAFGDIGFDVSSFTGTIDNVIVQYVSNSYVILGGGPTTLSNVVLEGNYWLGTALTKYAVDLKGTASNYLKISGICQGAAMTACVNFANETPTHIVVDTLGAGLSGANIGMHAERGRPFGIGTLTPRSTVALDLDGTDNAAKPLGLPTGTTAQRPTCDSAMDGGIRYNTTTSKVESCQGSSLAWVAFQPDSADATSGLYANKPASPTAGQQYYATDVGQGGITIVYDGTKWKPLSGKAVIYNSGVATGSHTGDTTETAVQTLSFPAGLVSANGTIRIYSLFSFTGTAGTKTTNYYLSTTAGGRNQKFYFSSGAAGNLSRSIFRQVTNRNSTSSQVHNNNTATILFGADSSSTNYTTTFNMSGAWYLDITGQLANGADSYQMDALEVEWIEP